MSNNLDEILGGEDDIAAVNNLEHFVELEEVIEMITNVTAQTVESSGFEKTYERYYNILSRYHEQPHLLDPHIESLLSLLLDRVRTGAPDEVHAAFKFLYVICKVRKYKVFVKFLPHELRDFDFALDLLEQQDSNENMNWETRYMLLLWLSIVVLNPFHMSRLDAYDLKENIDQTCAHSKTKMDRIFELCQQYTATNSSCAVTAAYLTAKFLIRSDIKEIYLNRYFEYVIEQYSANAENVQLGQLSAIAAILKHGKREDMLPYVEKLFKWITNCQYKNGTEFSKYKMYIKIVQRIGLVYLKPRVAAWRYNRGTRSLVSNLKQLESAHHSETTDLSNSEDSEEFEVPSIIEEVIEELLEALRSSASNIRWNSAKGIGRVTNRLPQCLADQVIGNVMEILNPLEPHEAWHGACLALAELAKRGLLLPSRLEQLIPLLMDALFYDVLKGYMSVGQHIRDSACYMCWAFARAYQPEDLQPFVLRISAALITVSLFDREINCRRAAAAAFQESVGRLGNFPSGIEISTKIDFFTVGTRQKTFLELSDFIAHFNDYKQALIDHLVKYKVNHWDINIRILAAKALSKLTVHAPDYMAGIVLQKLLKYAEMSDINARHGGVLSIGEIILALYQINVASNANKKIQLSVEVNNQLNDLISMFMRREQFRGMCGDLMKACSLEYIKNCSSAKLQNTQECLTCWQNIIDKCLIHKLENIREAAKAALAEVCVAYYLEAERQTANAKILKQYLVGTKNDNEQNIRIGYIGALAALPSFIVLPHLDDVINIFIMHALVDKTNNGERTAKWSESRASSVKALNELVLKIGFDKNNELSFANSSRLHKVFDTLLEASNEYTIDDRGDIGAWVREAAMKALYGIVTKGPSQILKPEYVNQIISSYMQQAVEKIDRTRGIAGRLCSQLIHIQPNIPYIKEHECLQKIFPTDPDTVLWLFADHTFPLFCAILKFPAYSKRILLGLSASIGDLSESLVKYSSAALIEFLRSHDEMIPRLCSEIVANFEENALNDRITHPMLNFLDILLSSGTVSGVIHDETNSFAEDIFRLLNQEVKGFKKMYKLASSISVYCQLIQVPRLSKRVLSKMGIFLGLQYVHIRKVSATKLYEALALHGDVTDIPEENMDAILALLSETDFGLPLPEVRAVRNQLCNLMGVKPPISTGAITSNVIERM